MVRAAFSCRSCWYSPYGKGSCRFDERPGAISCRKYQCSKRLRKCTYESVYDDLSLITEALIGCQKNSYKVENLDSPQRIKHFARRNDKHLPNSKILTMKYLSVGVSSFLALASTVSAFVVDPSIRVSKTAITARKTKEENGKSSEMDPAKRAALDGVLNQIERSYGRGSIVKLGDADHMVVDSISTGALTLDAALGGGYPKGRVIEIYGPESSGKTTLALHAIAECQRSGGTAAFVDAEHALDPAYGM